MIFPLWRGFERLYRQWVDELAAHDVAAVVIVDRRSFTEAQWRNRRFLDALRRWARLFPDVVCWFIGNEPDMEEGDSSSRQTRRDFQKLCRNARTVLPDAYLIAGALAFVKPSYVDGLQDVVNAFGVNIYGQRPAEDFPEPGWGFANVWDLLAMFPEHFPIVVKEMGGRAAEFPGGEPQRAEYFSRMFVVLAKLGVELAGVYCLRGGPEVREYAIAETESFAAFVGAAPEVNVAPELAAARFGVWNGVSIQRRYQSLEEVHAAVQELNPYPERWAPEWLVKAGEAGTWQLAWDSHPLAISGPEDLRALYERGQEIGLLVTPYVIVRGRAEWNAGEWAQIAACAEITGRVVLNLEDGPRYWNGPTRAWALAAEYLAPLRERLPAGAQLELCAIPRNHVVHSLGGPAAIAAWLSLCTSCSWECYDAIAPDLDVAASMERVAGWFNLAGVALRPEYFIPLVQRSRIGDWAPTIYAAHGLQVWHLDGD